MKTSGCFKSFLVKSINQLYVFLVFFFFQAEDGIRDVAVTGVQTCALPISAPAQSGQGRRSTFGSWPGRDHRAGPGRRGTAARGRPLLSSEPGGRSSFASREIGRASCRERV